MNMYHSPKKFSKYIVPALAYNDKKATMDTWWHLHNDSNIEELKQHLHTVILSIYNIYKKQQ